VTIVRRPDTTPTEHAQQAPWLESVTVPAGFALLFVSGQVPPVVDARFGIDDRRAYGDMETQATGVLERLDGKLRAAGFALGDVVKLAVFVVGEDALGGRPDLEGFGRAYRRFFGTVDQPHLHARTRIQVASLMNPAWLVEIEAVAAAAASDAPPFEHSLQGGDRTT